MRKILIGNILSMAKSLGYDVPGQIKCDAQVHFRKDRLKDVSVMTFDGKFQIKFPDPGLPWHREISLARVRRGTTTESR